MESDRSWCGCVGCGCDNGSSWKTHGVFFWPEVLAGCSPGCRRNIPDRSHRSSWVPSLVQLIPGAGFRLPVAGFPLPGHTPLNSASQKLALRRKKTFHHKITDSEQLLLYTVWQRCLHNYIRSHCRVMLCRVYRPFIKLNNLSYQY